MSIEIVGPDAAELLDSIHILNKGQSADIHQSSKYFTITSLDKTSYQINDNSFSINVILSTTGYESPILGKIYNSEKDSWSYFTPPTSNEYLRSANEYLENHGYKSKLYQL